jgi:hypothetical protein
MSQVSFGRRPLRMGSRSSVAAYPEARSARMPTVLAGSPKGVLQSSGGGSGSGRRSKATRLRFRARRAPTPAARSHTPPLEGLAERCGISVPHAVTPVRIHSIDRRTRSGRSAAAARSRGGVVSPVPVPGRRRAQPAPGWVPASTESMMLRSGDVVGTLCTVRTSDGPGDRSRVCRRTPEEAPAHVWLAAAVDAPPRGMTSDNACNSNAPSCDTTAPASRDGIHAAS